jgi:hypothetical protein
LYQFPHIEQSRDDNTIVLDVFTQRPINAHCTEAEGQFGIPVHLDVDGLEPGIYTVTAGRAAVTIELTSKGAVQPPPDVAPAIPVPDACTQSDTSIDADGLFRGIASPRQEINNPYILISTQGELERQWTNFGLSGPTPAIDFERRQVLLIYESYSSTPADLQLAGVVESQDAVQVHFMFNVHAEEVLGSPHLLIMAVERPDLELLFVRHEYFVWEEQTRRVISPELVSSAWENGKVWVNMVPTQCMSNPWEMSWRGTNGADYPKDFHTPWLDPGEAEIVKEYYHERGVPVFAIQSEPWPQRGVCRACSCPEGYSLHLLVLDADVDQMLAWGYAISD